LLVPDGVVLGRFERYYLRHDGPEHVLCFAPTRSGKGVGLVVPTLLTWPGSVVVDDIKGENFKLTAGWCSRFGRALLFDPTDPASSAYNPLLKVRRSSSEVRDVQNVELVGTILHVLYAEADKTLAGVANFSRTLAGRSRARSRP
jgi:type IV secretion system protein VirD4